MLSIVLLLNVVSDYYLPRSIEYPARFLMPRVFILRVCTGEEDFDECLNLACAASEHMAWHISKLVSMVYLQPPYLLWIC